ncbi:PleD family two-component system response regulator [Microbaculum sp. FT89]|uniref:PleD family two-component system response regulator n=1 Tax=Microbaculum sp. FT89 TaxID=3447298 RepID=UPI003F53CEC2
MTARVLVVDDTPANVKLLQVRLTAEYFEVVSATNGYQALELAERSACDIILLDVMMPGMDGFETCRRLKANPATHHIPVVMITALDSPEDRVQGLKAGADDFLTKPVSDIAVATRVRSLSRLKLMTDELRLRAASGRHMGIDDPLAAAIQVSGENGRILIVDDRTEAADRTRAILEGHHRAEIETRPQEALFRAAEGQYDCVMISLALNGFDPLRLCSQLRSLDRTRDLPLLLVAESDDTARVLRGLDMGVNDYVLRPIDHDELIARAATQVRRRRYTEKLRDNVQLSVTMAVTDPLTGLHNRRYMEAHLRTLVGQGVENGRALSVLVLDIDYFKSINDDLGHDAGDEVLRQFAARLRSCTRGVDLACRYGGEEFVVVMPETEVPVALRVGERIRQAIGREPFVVGPGRQTIDMTVSIGVAVLEHPDDTPERLLKRADHALYAAKREGRNRVAAEAA